MLTKPRDLDRVNVILFIVFYLITVQITGSIQIQNFAINFISYNAWFFAFTILYSKSFKFTVINTIQFRFKMSGSLHLLLIPLLPFHPLPVVGPIYVFIQPYSYYSEQLAIHHNIHFMNFYYQNFLRHYRGCFAQKSLVYGFFSFSHFVALFSHFLRESYFHCLVH